MNRFVPAVLVAVLAFTAGAFSGRWYEARRPLPPPPGPWMGEFGGSRPGPSRAVSSPISRADFIAEAERLRPQIVAFRKHLDEIEDEFERDLGIILTPEQRVLNAERLRRRAEARTAADGRRPDEERLMHLAQVPNMVLLRYVTLQMGYEYLNRDLKFNAAQRDKVFDLLRIRRSRVLEFVDKNPPPSVRLMLLAPYAQRLAPPPAAQDGPGPKP
jgi:hypothetical protein